MTIKAIQSLNIGPLQYVQQAHRISKGEESPTEAISGIVKHAFANCEKLGKYKWVNNVTARIMYWCARLVLAIKRYSPNEKFAARLALDVLFRATLCTVDLRSAVAKSEKDLIAKSEKDPIPKNEKDLIAKNKNERLIAATTYGGVKEIQDLLTRRLAGNQFFADTHAEMETVILKHLKAALENPFTVATAYQDCQEEILNILEKRFANDLRIKRTCTRIKEAGTNRVQPLLETLPTMSDFDKCVKELQNLFEDKIKHPLFKSIYKKIKEVGTNHIQNLPTMVSGFDECVEELQNLFENPASHPLLECTSTEIQGIVSEHTKALLKTLLSSGEEIARS